ncbi:MAG: hypothetical protein ACLRSD_09610 [Oscillibacter sp.]
MKSTSVSTKIITILLLLAVIGYFAVQGYNYFVSPETTTLVYRYHSERSIALRGYVVRDEQVVDCNETLHRAQARRGRARGPGRHHRLRLPLGRRAERHAAARDTARAERAA